LKNLARELQCPIIALSQLSRSVEQRNPPIPILSDLRESGSIEQDADTVLMLYRDDAYNEDSAEPGMPDVYVRKNRNGPTARVSLGCNHARMSFPDLQQPLAAGRAALDRRGPGFLPAATGGPSGGGTGGWNPTGLSHPLAADHGSMRERPSRSFARE